MKSFSKLVAALLLSLPLTSAVLAADDQGVGGCPPGTVPFSTGGDSSGTVCFPAE